MIQWLLIDFLVFACVAALTGVIIPQILLIAFRKNLFDTPDPRKIHKTEIPRLGGIAFFPSILFALLLLLGVGVLSEDQSILVRVHKHILPLCFIECGAIILYLTGMADDLVGVRYGAKFVMQIIAAGLVMIGGMRIDSLHGFMGISHMPFGLSILLTGLVIVFIINSINLIDGIDGLASGLSAIACCFYAYVFFQSEHYIFSAMAVATLGALLPFFFYNVFGDATKRRKIFMGDTGALTIGLFLSVMSIEICSIDYLPSRSNPAIVAFAPLLIPCLDVVRVYLHRVRAGRNPFLPDKSHIHHKLLAAGLTQRKAMMTIVGSSALLIGANYWLSEFMDITLLFVCDLVFWVGVNMLLTISINSRERRQTTKIYE